MKVRDTLAPKVQGFRSVVAAVNTDALRLLVTFGSVIGRVGLRGEADYALANAALSALTEEFATFIHVPCLAFESSVVGYRMAESWAQWRPCATQHYLHPLTEGISVP